MMWVKSKISILILFILVFVAGISTGQAKSSLCHQEGYTCVKVKRHQSWQSLFPEERERSIVMRINHTNGQLYAGRTIAVPDNLDKADLLDFSPLPRTIEAQNEKVIIVDLKKHAWGAYDADGTLIRWGPATGGSDWCKDLDRPCHTKQGNFRIYSLGSSSCVSTKFPRPRGGAPMPYCMFFNGGQALHGSPGEVVDGNISHGCVRLFVDDAEWLRYDFVEPPMSSNGYRGTRVEVVNGKEESSDDDQSDNQDDNQDDNDNNY